MFAIWVPSGDQATRVLPASWSVTLVAPEPFAFMTQSSAALPV